MLRGAEIIHDYYQSSSWTVFEMLVVGVVTTFLAWYAQWHWSRRHLYELAAKVPGPTPLPFIGSALYFLGSPKYIYDNVMKLFEDYPVIIRVWFGNRLFFGIQKAEDLQILLNSPKAYAKEDLYRYAQRIAGLGLFTAPVPKWKRHRKLISPTFNQRILDNFVEVFGEKSNILVEQLKKFSGKGEFDIFHTVSNCTLDILCETAMGVNVHAQTTVSEFGHWVDKLLEIIFLRMFVISYHFDFLFKLSKHHRIEEDMATKLHAFTDKIVKEKRQAYGKKMEEAKSFPEDYCEEQPGKRKAFLDMLIELSYEGANFTDVDLRDEVNTFMIAGTDTTASSNCFTFLTLAMHPDVQEKVYEEVMEVLGPDRVLTAEDLPKLKYTERVIKETLRLFPVGAFIVRAIEEDLKLTTCTLPGNSSPIIAIHSVHKNPKYWPDPNKFDPDRFLPEEIAKRHPYTYMPFSAGPRNCIGPRYAMMVMKSLVASVIRKFKITTSYKGVEDVELKTNLVLRPCKGYKVSFETRE